MESKKIDSLFYLLALALLAPALLINLGLLTFIDDEGIRSVVALEMLYSGNFITPTIHGEYYYKKPPLFNWILAAVFQVTGRQDEFIARLPTVVALLGYAATVYYFFRKHYDQKTAFLHAMVLITCGRMLFWDSMLALIDVTFSWVIFTNFMIIYHYFEKQKWWTLFLLSYLLCAIGFLLKGLPALVFQGLTLLPYFIYRGAFRRLFHWPHFLSGIFFLVFVGSYYLAYHLYNDLGVLFKILVTESSQRTAVNYGWWDTIAHLFSFPFEMTYHFFPWSLLVLCFFDRRVRYWMGDDPFIVYLAITFFANILVYWTSPEVYPRYLLMLAPLFFGLGIYLYGFHQQKETIPYHILSWAFGILMGVIALACYAPLFLDRTRDTSGLIWKTMVTAVPMTVLAAVYWRLLAQRLMILAVFLLLFRTFFNFFVLPDRNANDYGDKCRQTSLAVGKRFRGQPLKVYGQTDMQRTNSYYLTRAYGAIIPVDTTPQVGESLYIIDSTWQQINFEPLDSFYVRHYRMIYQVGALQ